MRVLPLFLPVISEQREGELMPLPAYACVKLVPVRASLSMFGVWIYSLP